MIGKLFLAYTRSYTTHNNNICKIFQVFRVHSTSSRLLFIISSWRCKRNVWSYLSQHIRGRSRLGKSKETHCMLPSKFYSYLSSFLVYLSSICLIILYILTLQNLLENVPSNEEFKSLLGNPKNKEDFDRVHAVALSLKTLTYRWKRSYR